jgi:glycine dehydrogenase subunit 1
MLAVCGKRTLDGLFDSIPASLRLKEIPGVGEGLGESGTLRAFDRIFGSTRHVRTCLAGAGCYRHFIPAALDAIVSRGEFLTAYTPYQAEISQGLLQAIWEYQEIISRLTGLEIANASHYDGATALAEACVMASAITGRKKIVVSRGIHPQMRQVMETYDPSGRFVRADAALEDYRTRLPSGQDLSDSAALVLQQPNYYGIIEDLSAAAEICRQSGALLIVSFNPIAAGLLKRPGECGADIVTGEGQPLGIPMSFGGPGFGFMACRKKHVRYLPGRIVGPTVDALGRKAYVLTLQAREQHIRREKAASNICSNQAHAALRASVYCSLLGDEGLRAVATKSCANARYLKKSLLATGRLTSLTEAPFFHEFPLAFASDAERDHVRTALLDEGVLFGVPLTGIPGGILLAATECALPEEIDRVMALMGRIR